jgi:hypothetical protein
VNKEKNTNCGFVWIWLGVTASTMTILGLIWDISWHQSIGRDTFWSPPHLPIYLGSFLAGVISSTIILSNKFSKSTPKLPGITVWGFNGPSGSWIMLWGALCMLSAGGFDDWWHNAYGVDVGIITLPHSVLAIGLISIQLGTLILIHNLRYLNSTKQRLCDFLIIFESGLLLLTLFTLFQQQLPPNYQHSAVTYQYLAFILPIPLMLCSTVGRYKFAMTTATLIYFLLELAMVWILPLFPASPRLAPVYNQIYIMMPPDFPFLLFIPALILESLSSLLPFFKKHFVSLFAILFIPLLLTVQWNFSEFLLTEESRNWFFGRGHWPYSSLLGHWNYQFLSLDTDTQGVFSPWLLTKGIIIAIFISLITASIGRTLGRTINNLKR